MTIVMNYCFTCGQWAELPDEVYCRECANAYFKNFQKKNAHQQGHAC